MSRRRLVLAATAALALGAALGALLAHDEGGAPPRSGPTIERTGTQGRRRPGPSVAWPTYRVDARRTGAYDATRARPPFRLTWKLAAGSLLEFPPVVAGGRLYLTTHEGRVLAVPTRTGRPVWELRSGRCAASSPAFAGGLLLVSLLDRLPCGGEAADGLLLALRASDGRERWRLSLGPNESSPLVVGDTAYVGSWDHAVYAVATPTGRLRWRARTQGPVKAGLAYAGGSVYVGSYDGRIYAFDARTGAIRWQAGPFAGNFYATPAVAYGLVVVGATSGVVYALDAATGRLRWTVATGSYVYSAAAVWHRTAYVGSYDGRMYAIDARTGRLRWNFAGHAPVSGAITVVGGVVYFSTCSVCVRGQTRPGSRTYALDAGTGRRLWSFPDGEYAGVVADRERLYLVGYSALYGLRPMGS